MNVKRIAVTLTVLGAATVAGVTAASAATIPTSQVFSADHTNWCGQQQWARGDHRWQQCKDVPGWWDNNTCYNQDAYDNYTTYDNDNTCYDNGNAYQGNAYGNNRPDHPRDDVHGAVTGRRRH
ncbi:MAG TPA: hypothetical protein VHV82_13395 [Sporichthyaceae bacterium]|jgi:hypothetical protein|nr:hypothetical protein [Sporichthyaceae bacterium]